MRININGRRLFFDVGGTKFVPQGPEMVERPTLIALHGAPGFSDHSTLRPGLDPLHEDMQVIYLDLCGAGRSDDTLDGQKYSLDMWADDLVALCDALEIKKPIVLGLSGGGFVAQAYAIRHSEHVGGVILASTQAKFTPSRSISMFTELGGKRAAAAAQDFLIEGMTPETTVEYAVQCSPYYNPTPADPEAASRVIMRPELAEAFHQTGKGIWYQMDLLSDLSKVTCPVLILAGSKDPITPLEDSRDMANALDRNVCRLEELADCGHGTWRDKPDESFAIIRDFVHSNSENGNK